MEKTAARKIEEMLIVWMIENNNIMSKSRMLEIYFNIIEWGNNIYGIKEAARYYFGKTPHIFKCFVHFHQLFRKRVYILFWINELKSWEKSCAS